jgi:tetratricopeptide (TPR) repeat protein
VRRAWRARGRRLRRALCALAGRAPTAREPARGADPLLPASGSAQPLHPTTDAPLGLALGQLTGAERPALEASPLGQSALEGKEQTPGARHEDTRIADFALDQLHEKQGELDEAESLYCRVLDWREETHGGANLTLTLATVCEMASKLEAQGELDEALPLYRHVLEGQEQTLGATHEDTLATVSALAQLLERQGKLDEALPLYRRVLEGREKELGASHEDTLEAAAALACALVKKGELDEAESLCRRLLEGQEPAGADARRKSGASS